ncbi:hypothetical protein KY331_03230 [Candidatus Woesearchaeota archaeon]|nr:hypothetical protein [Candidatus Woesearchaeota archaeon]
MKKKLNVKLIIKRNEKKFRSKGRSINYLYFPCLNKKKRKGLIISFGAWPGPQYNRIRDYYENERKEYDLLYLEDGFGYKHQGVFYLAEKGDFSIEEIYAKLINKIIKKSKVPKEKVYCLGSSMGGFAALYFAYKLNLGKVVAIGPLIKLRKLYQKSKGHKKLYKFIINDSKFNLDKLILKKFDKKVDTEVHIIYQHNDDLTIKGGISDLLKILIKNENKFSVESFDIKTSKNISNHIIISYITDRIKIMKEFNEKLTINYPPK